MSYKHKINKTISSSSSSSDSSSSSSSSSDQDYKNNFGNYDSDSDSDNEDIEEIYEYIKQKLRNGNKINSDINDVQLNEKMVYFGMDKKEYNMVSYLLNNGKYSNNFLKNLLLKTTNNNIKKIIEQKLKNSWMSKLKT